MIKKVKSANGVLCIFLLVLAYSNVFGQEYDITRFDDDSGLPQSYVYSISQDSLGNLWISTGENLFSYDGFTFNPVQLPDSIPDRMISCCLRDGNVIWFGHAGGTVSCYNGKNFAIANESNKGFGRITNIVKGPDGKLWLSSSGKGLFTIDRKYKKVDMVFGKPAGEQISSFSFLLSGGMLLGTSSGAALWTGKTDPFELEKISGIPSSPVSSIVRAGKNQVYYISTENDGIYSLDLQKGSHEIRRIDSELNIQGVQSVFCDSKSNIWVSSFGKGLVKISSVTGEAMVFNTSNGFSSNNVKTVFEDREGNIWCGNFGDGLVRFTTRFFSVSQFERDSYGSNVISIYTDDRTRWIGTDRGLLKLSAQNGSIEKFYGPTGGLMNDSVTALTYHKGKIWGGTGSNGIFSVDVATGNLGKYSLSDGKLENSITCIVSCNGNLCIGTKKGLCIFNPGDGSKKWYTINQGLPHNYIIHLYPDASRLWISTKSRIVSYLEKGLVEKLTFDMGNSMATCSAILKDPLGRIWAGSNGSGIFIVEKDSVFNLTAEHGLISDFCYSLVFDGKHVWAGHKGGLSRIDISDFNIRRVKRFQNLKDVRFNQDAAIADKSGNLLFGTDAGLVFTNTIDNIERSEPPLLNITSVRINEEEIDVEAGKIVLPPGNYRIRISYLGSSLTDPEEVSYQSILNGYDRDWSEISSERSVYYPGLGAGDYTFLLKASSGQGIVTENPLKLEISVKMPVWKEWWFFPVMVVLWTSLVWVFLKRREKLLLREKSILEEKVKARTHEIECQKKEIEKQRDEIDEINLNITSSIRYARQIQKALLPPREILDRNLPENFIMHRPRDIVSGDFYWMAEKDGKVVFTVADCTGHGVPGAFMSLLGITLLNEIVNLAGITRSDQILNELRRRVVYCLSQQKRDIVTHDGIELSLCVLDKKARTIQFTGGMNDMIRIRDGKLEIIKADHLDVSVSYLELGDFTVRELDYRKGDMIYLFSDGYQDQFGGEFDKKFLKPHFYTTLVEIHKRPVLNQKELLEQKLSDWMKNHPQTDDITVMGIRF